VPPSTFSIVACDLARREWGIAVQSKFLAVGALVSWAEAEVGALATQAWMNVDYGPGGLALLRQGASARETLERLTAADPGRAQRQLGIVDREGRSASYTGAGCLEWAGSRIAEGYAVQGNILASAATVDRMAETFEAGAPRPLAGRLLAALAGGQEAGGDRRGQQAASLLVVAKGAGYGGCDVAVDLRVDDHERPIAELQRLYELHQLYFGQTPAEEWLRVTPALSGELAERLGRLGYTSGSLSDDLETWAGFVNLEERVRGAAALDPVVLAELRKQSESNEGGRDERQRAAG
jgi:uncharacterized Ntn-hydrolase superfamily protein